MNNKTILIVGTGPAGCCPATHYLDTSPGLSHAVERLISEGHAVEVVTPDDPRVKELSTPAPAPFYPTHVDPPEPYVGDFNPPQTRAQRRAKARQGAKHRR